MNKLDYYLIYKIFVEGFIKLLIIFLLFKGVGYIEYKK